MSNFHLDQKGARQTYTFTGEQLAQLLSDMVETFVVYLATEPADVAVMYAVNEMMAKVKRGEKNDD